MTFEIIRHSSNGFCIRCSVAPEIQLHTRIFTDEQSAKKVMEELMFRREEGRLSMRITFHEPHFRLELITPRNAVVALGKACESYRECVDLVVGEEYID